LWGKPFDLPPFVLPLPFSIYLLYYYYYYYL
jgi:hypothetical protein